MFHYRQQEQYAALYRAFIERQRAEPRRADEYAKALIKHGGEVLAASEHWARTGLMPDWPEVAGRTPASLQKGRKPSETLTALAVLQLDPVRGAQLLAHRRVKVARKENRDTVVQTL
jgi:hypothetical protein